MLGVDSRIVFEERLAPCVTFDLQKYFSQKNLPVFPQKQFGYQPPT